MDLSKLPRMSKTDRPPNTPEDDVAAGDAGAAVPPPAAVPERGAFCDRCGVALRPGARFCDGCGAPTPAGGALVPDYRAEPDVGVGPEAWISIAIGAIVLFLYHRTFEWLLGSKSLPVITDVNGNVIPYAKSAFFWQDLGPALFGVILVVEGLALVFARNRAVVSVALVLTLAAAAVNLWAIIATTKLIGFPIMSAIAVAFCVYIAIYQWRLLQSLTAAGRRASARA